MAEEIEELKGRLRLIEADNRVLKTSHQLLTNQMADLALQAKGMNENLQAAMKEAIKLGVKEFLIGAQDEAARTTFKWLVRTALAYVVRIGSLLVVAALFVKAIGPEAAMKLLQSIILPK